MIGHLKAGWSPIDVSSGSKEIVSIFGEECGHCLIMGADSAVFALDLADKILEQPVLFLRGCGGIFHLFKVRHGIQDKHRHAFTGPVAQFGGEFWQPEGPAFRSFVQVVISYRESARGTAVCYAASSGATPTVHC